MNDPKPSLRVLLIKHNGSGEAEDGEQLCNEVRARLGGLADRLLVFHDATGMTLASPAYASAFMKLDKDISAQVERYVCAIPASIPRMMAHTVAMVSSKEWRIFKSTGEAVAHLSSQGFQLSADDLARSGRVLLR